MLDVNVVGMARVARAALPVLRESQRAAIVNTSSVVAVVGVKNRALYSASKGAVHPRDGRGPCGRRIRVNAVAPGTADTLGRAAALTRRTTPPRWAMALRKRQPMGRLVTADEVAHAIAYLASLLSGSTTGTILSVDGGMAHLRP